MAKIGGFKNDKARERYMGCYRALEDLWPTSVSVTPLDVETSYGSTRIRKFGSGSGTPMVLIHPISGTGHAWAPFAETFASDRTVYALDTIGTAGKSVQTAPMTEGADYARWIGDVLDALDLESAHLFGYSEGAWHAALAGAGISERLASLTLGEPGAAVGKVSKKLLWRMIRLGMRPTNEGFAKFNAWLSPGIELSAVEVDCARASLGYRRRTPWQSPLKDEQLQSISCPTYAFFGAETVLADPKIGAERITANVLGARTEIIEGGGHSVLWQMPGSVVPAVMEFVRSHDEVTA
nr:alpha/beta hydrolase [Rhodococcus sp. (in: high G+C Gram-positive bacteria)]